MKKLFLIFCSFVLIGFFSNVTNACSCEVLEDLNKTEKQIVTKAKNEAMAVFIGKPIEITQKISKEFVEVFVKFEVEKSYKSIKSKFVTLNTSYPRNQTYFCQYDFKIDIKYLVYAFGKDELTTTLCSRTTSFENGESGDGKIRRGKRTASFDRY